MIFRTVRSRGSQGAVELLREVRPGDMLIFRTTENADTSDVAYGGCASVNGESVLRLHHCMGPMVAIGEFDDPDLLRARLALLRGEGAVPGAFAATGVPVFSLDGLAVEEGSQMKARDVCRFPRRLLSSATIFQNAPCFPAPCS